MLTYAAGAFIRFGPDLKPHFTTFTAAPHPDVRAMKYAPMMGNMMAAS
jgi:hypothetical protein